MNCKPNDMAMVVKRGSKLIQTGTGEGRDVLHMGVVVTVVAHDGNVWLLAEPVRFECKFSNGAEYTGTVIGIADEILRPMPKLFSQDEVLRLVGLPNQPEKGATVLIDLQL